uniref:Immunoglobulin V-set domain-containing protein n=1 Tax=Bos indicus x Bos taurus TaxID=30522 RepID=A0A4W2GPE9_BOBOX
KLVGTVLGLLFAGVCCVRGVDVEQSPPALTPQEGASSTLWCNFSTLADSVRWYLQKPGGTSSTSFTFLQEQGRKED